MKNKLNLNICLTITIVALLGSLESATAQGNLVVNGGFDTDASGWTITDVDTLGGYQSELGNPGGAISLYDSSLSEVPTASQFITLTLGDTYIISGDYRGSGKDNTDPGLGVGINGLMLFQAAATDFAWHSFSFEYTATSMSAQLSLSAQLGGSDAHFLIDNIAMQAVPEPATYVLFLAGLGTLGFRWLRKSPA